MHGVLLRLRKNRQRHMSNSSPKNEQTLTVSRVERGDGDKRTRHSRKQKQRIKAGGKKKLDSLQNVMVFSTT